MYTHRYTHLTTHTHTHAHIHTHTYTQIHTHTHTPTHTHPQVGDIKEKLKQSRKFWSGLPGELCPGTRVEEGDAEGDGCWNGHTLGRYARWG